MAEARNEWRDFAHNAAIRGLLSLALLVPYRHRVPLFGWLVARVIAPFAGWRRRVAENLALVRPDLPLAERRRLERAVPDNAGRTLIEIYSGREFIDRVRDAPLTGAGLVPFREAVAARRPVILVTAHFGNYDAARAALVARGYPMAALYRPMRNAAFNAHYVRAISTIGEPVFPSDRRGVLKLVKHLAAGHTIGILIDVNTAGAPELDFFGHPARTALSAAEWALRYDALVVPIYGIRRETGLDFDIVLDAPIPHGPPEAMTQALNDSLESHVRRHMDQWFWIHRRWSYKSRHKRRDGAAAVAPPATARRS